MRRRKVHREQLELHHLYGAMDFLEAHKEEIEEAIYFKMADLLNADVDLIFYDTTSLHFESDDENEETGHGARPQGARSTPRSASEANRKTGGAMPPR